MKIGDIVLILPSVALEDEGLSALIGQKAVIVEINGSFENIKGCWVELHDEYLGEREWYIPYNSIGQ